MLRSHTPPPHVTPQNAQRSDPVDAKLAAFYDIVLATDAMICALDRGQSLENDDLEITKLKKTLEHFQHALVAG